MSYEPQDHYHYPGRNPQGLIFDGKRMRKAIVRKTVDYSSSTALYEEVNLF